MLETPKTKVKMGNQELILLFLLYRDSWTPHSSPRHWPRSRNLAVCCPGGSCDFLVPNPPSPPKKKGMIVPFWGRGLAPNNGVRVGLVLEARLFVSFIYSQNPKFRDRVFEYSTLTQVAGAVSCRHECPVCRLLEPKVRGSEVQVLDLGPVSRHYRHVSLCLLAARLSHTRCSPSFFCALSTQSQSQVGVSQFNCFVCKDKYFWAPRYSSRPWPKSQSQVNCRSESSSSLVLAHLSQRLTRWAYSFPFSRRPSSTLLNMNISENFI